MVLIHLRTHHWDEHGRLYRPAEHDVPLELAVRWGFAEPQPVEPPAPGPLPSIRALSAALVGMSDEEVRAMMARDDRSTAAPIYRARLGA